MFEVSTVYKVYPDTGYLSVNIDVAPSTLNTLQPDVVLADYLNKLAEVSVGLIFGVHERSIDRYGTNRLSSRREDGPGTSSSPARTSPS